MGAAADKGWGGLANDNPMDGPAQITQLGDFLAGLIDATKPTLADLPSSGNWEGRAFYVVATKRVYRWVSTGGSSFGWAAVAGADEVGTIGTPGFDVVVNTAASYVRKDVTGMVNGYAAVSRTKLNGGMANDLVVATIPAGFRPANGANRIFSASVSGTDTRGALARIETNGDIRLFQDVALPVDAIAFAVKFEYPAAS